MTEQEAQDKYKRWKELLDKTIPLTNQEESEFDVLENELLDYEVSKLKDDE